MIYFRLSLSYNTEALPKLLDEYNLEESKKSVLYVINFFHFHFINSVKNIFITYTAKIKKSFNKNKDCSKYLLVYKFFF